MRLPRRSQKQIFQFLPYTSGLSYRSRFNGTLLPMVGQKGDLPRDHPTAGWKQSQSTVLTGLLKKDTSRQRTAGGRTPRALPAILGPARRRTALPDQVLTAGIHPSITFRPDYCRGHNRRLCRKVARSPSGAEGGNGITEGHQLRTKYLCIRMAEAILIPYSSPGPIQGDDQSNR